MADRPDDWTRGYLNATLVDEPNLKIARISRRRPGWRCSIMEMHHLVADADGVHSFVERHEMGLLRQSSTALPSSKPVCW